MSHPLTLLALNKNQLEVNGTEPKVTWSDDLQEERDELLAALKKEEESNLLSFVLMIFATLIICMGITEYHDAKQDAAQVSALLAQCANGKSIPFDGAMIECRRIEFVQGLK